jgi:TRAP-type uncharacterized transport system substrate-binding protein
MIGRLAAGILSVIAVAAPLALALQPAAAQAQGGQQQAAPVRRGLTYEQQQEKINAWTVGLAAGRIEGAPLRLAAEMARVVDDGANMLVLPIVTRGPVENLNSLLYLRGVDMAIINSDALEEYKVEFPDLRLHVTYLLNLFPSELHIFVRPEIQSLQDLAGKKVNFNTLGTAAAYSGPLIFSRLGINVEKTFIPHQQALQQMRKGEGDMAAVVFITSKPVDAFLRGQWEPGFKFLPVTYNDKFEDYYQPSFLEAADYPALIKAGERVSTISVPTLLVSYNWPTGSDRYRRVARFTDYLFTRVDKLQVGGFDPQWKAINLRATAPGLARFPAAQQWLDHQARQPTDKR